MIREHTPSPVRRSGFTLLEIIIVMAILLVIASLSWPALMRYLREQEIREQAHVVRLEIAGAHSKAIDSGLTYQFRFEPGGRRFVVIPHDRPDVGAGGDSSQPAPSPTATSNGPVDPIAVVSGQLPETCHFDRPTARNAVTHADQAVITEKLPEEWLALVPNSNSLRETSWAPAVRFYPDGSADDGSLTVMDDDDRQIEITIRGLTGTVNNGPLKRERPL